MAVEESIEAGRAALKKGRWQDAVAAFEKSLAEKDSAEALDGMAEALWWLCEARSSVRYRERAYVKFRETGDAPRACRAAVNLSISYLVNLGNEAAARGWLARAERVISHADPNPMQGWLWLMRGFLAPDPDRPWKYLSKALDWARDTGDVDLEFVALTDLGLALVVAGEPDEGISLLDEAMAGTLAGEYSDSTRSCTRPATYSRPATTSAISSAHRSGARSRTTSCATAARFCSRAVVHYGSVLLAKGQWTRAEDELQSALRMSKDAGPGPYDEALVRLAHLRARQGRLEKAEALLRDFNDAVVPFPAAELRLIRGEPAVAVALLVRRMEQLGETHIEAAATLAMLVDAHIACGDFGAAGEVAVRLDAIAQARGGDAAALSAIAAAHVAATNRQSHSTAQLEKALETFTRLDLPLETARVRLELADALAERQPEIAVDEAGRALTTFEELSATADADAAAALLRSLGAPGRTGPKHFGVLTKREQEVLQLVGLGLPNPEIAQRLFISRKTAAHNVSNLLAKLGLRNRAEAVAYAVRSQYQQGPT